MNTTYEFSYDSKLWSKDTNKITDLPTDENGKLKIIEDMKSLVEGLISDISKIKSFTFGEPSEENNHFTPLFSLSIESDEDLTDVIYNKFNDYTTEVSAYDYCDDLSEYEQDEDPEDDESGWNLEEVTIELYVDEY